MNIVYDKPSFTSDAFPTAYCPGCGHGTIHKSMALAIDKLGIREKTVMVYPIGCAGLAGPWVNLNTLSSGHGRAGAIASAVKKTNPDNIVIAYQGDGDLAAIGMAETMHAANRGESITVIFVNNTNFGMTGGQMAPTTLIGQKATTSPNGRDLEQHGAPFKMAELIAKLDAPKFVTRCAVHDAKSALKAQAAIEKGLQMQIDKKGYSFIEILSICPTNWKKTPLDSAKYIDEVVSQTYPLGVFKDVE